jgi:hypothetical protein
LVLYRSQMHKAAEKLGLPIARESFPDRLYDDDGNLASGAPASSRRNFARPSERCRRPAVDRLGAPGMAGPPSSLRLGDPGLSLHRLWAGGKPAMEPATALARLNPARSPLRRPAPATPRRDGPTTVSALRSASTRTTRPPTATGASPGSTRATSSRLPGTPAEC